MCRIDNYLFGVPYLGDTVNQDGGRLARAQEEQKFIFFFCAYACVVVVLTSNNNNNNFISTLDWIKFTTQKIRIKN